MKQELPVWLALNCKTILLLAKLQYLSTYKIALMFGFVVMRQKNRLLSKW